MISWSIAFIKHESTMCASALQLRSEVDDDGDAVDPNERTLVDSATVDVVLVAAGPVSTGACMKSEEGAYHWTPPRISMGVQPVPMGTFRAETSMPMADLTSEATVALLLFSTFWQHCAEFVVVHCPSRAESSRGSAETALTRARVEIKVLENMVFARGLVGGVRVVVRVRDVRWGGWLGMLELYANEDFAVRHSQDRATAWRQRLNVMDVGDKRKRGGAGTAELTRCIREHTAESSGSTDTVGTESPLTQCE
jgi:hypothetical protein